MTIVDPVPVQAPADDVDHWVCCVDTTRTLCGQTNHDPVIIDVACPELSGCVVCDDLARVVYRTTDCPVRHGPCPML